MDSSAMCCILLNFMFVDHLLGRVDFYNKIFSLN